jgi:hypothetical protein
MFTGNPNIHFTSYMQAVLNVLNLAPLFVSQALWRSYYFAAGYLIPLEFL